ncbi:hypothetical protein CDD83_10782 [Cordyceps sp. RAO-2017]|nr:hypothetical protein CDD83_10782 [Cordyceps sp. RAO-2017]
MRLAAQAPVQNRKIRPTPRAVLTTTSSSLLSRSRPFESEMAAQSSPESVLSEPLPLCFQCGSSFEFGYRVPCFQ